MNRRNNNSNKFSNNNNQASKQQARFHFRRGGSTATATATTSSSYRGFLVLLSFGLVILKSFWILNHYDHNILVVEDDGTTNSITSPPIQDIHESLKKMIDHVGTLPNVVDESNKNNNHGAKVVGTHDKGISKEAVNLKFMMQTRYQALPTIPPWPQLDHRISEEILNGLIIGVDDDSRNRNNQNSINTYHHQYNNTIVTAYYEFESKHGVNQYELWFSRILQCSEPMIIFVEPYSKWYHFAMDHRTHAPTIIVSLPFLDITMSKTFTKDFWDYMFSIDTEAKIHKSSNVYKIWNEKMIFMYGATMMNPFNTPGFAWMDAGYFRNRNDAPDMNTPIIKVNITNDGIPEERLVLLHVRNDPLSSVARVNVAGNSFLGTKRSFSEFYTRYYDTFWDWISQKKFIGSDQFVMTETCRRYKDLCHPFFPKRFKKWFAMAELMRGDLKDYTIVSKHYLFLDEPPALKGVPTGEIVSYRGEEVVTESRIGIKSVQ